MDMRWSKLQCGLNSNVLCIAIMAGNLSFKSDQDANIRKNLENLILRIWVNAYGTLRATTKCCLCCSKIPGIFQCSNENLNSILYDIFYIFLDADNTICQVAFRHTHTKQMKFREYTQRETVTRNTFNPFYSLALSLACLLIHYDF